MDTTEPERRGRRSPMRDRRPRRPAVRGVSGAGRWVLAVAGVVVLAVLAAAVLRAVTGDLYRVPSGSMEPLLQSGDRIRVERLAPTGTDGEGTAPIARGDVVVFDGTGSLAPYRSQSSLERGLEDALVWLGLRPDADAYVKRVAGLGGDTVSCCTADGLLEVNGEPVMEEYLAGQPASSVPFTAQVPEGRLFLLGDHRAESVDSRALLGAPGGGMIPVEKVIGRVTDIAWPASRRGPVDAGEPAGDG